ncbi:MAG: hypothetical protein R2834_13460 [Rhodothermales bacterium]
MIDILVYKLVHLLGIMMLFVAVGGAFVHSFNGGLKSENRWRSVIAISHGVGLTLILLGGFGMLARLNIAWPWPGWVFVKLGIWVVFGGITAVIQKMGRGGSWLWYVILLLGFTAAYLALYKPF